MRSQADSAERSAIVAFSFGKRRPHEEPNPSNTELASAVVRELEQSSGVRPLVVAQWEIAKGIVAHGQSVDLVVDEPDDGSYLSTDDVWEAAKLELTRHEVRDVLPVAQPFLHLPMIRRLIRGDGWRVIEEQMESVVFDDSERNLQWWTRGRVRLVA